MYVSVLLWCGGDVVFVVFEVIGINFEMRRGRFECIDRIFKVV